MAHNITPHSKTMKLPQGKKNTTPEREKGPSVLLLDRHVTGPDGHEVVHVGVLQSELAGHPLLGVDRLPVLVQVGIILIRLLAPLTSR